MKEMEEEANKDGYNTDNEEKEDNEINITKKVDNDNKKLILASKDSIIGVGELADSAIIFYIYVYTRSENYLTLKFKLNEKIKTEFDEEGIEIPYPQMDVHMVDKTVIY